MVGDITYLPTREGWLYLATVIDLHSREVVGHSMAEHMRAELVRDALDLAVRRGLIRDDAAFTPIAGRNTPPDCSAPRSPVTASARRWGGPGRAFDNAVAESFFATRKTEIGTPVWDTRADARRGVSPTWATITMTVYIRHSATGLRARGRRAGSTALGDDHRDRLVCLWPSITIDIWIRRCRSSTTP